MSLIQVLHSELQGVVLGDEVAAGALHHVHGKHDAGQHAVVMGEQVLLGVGLVQGLGGGNHVFPGPGLGDLHATLLQHGGVVEHGHGVQAGGQAQDLAIHGAAARQELIAHVGEVDLVGNGVEVHKVRAVPGHLSQPGLIQLDDVGRGAAGQLGQELVLVAVPAAVFGLDLNIGMRFLKQRVRLEGILMAFLAVPSGEAQGHGFLRQHRGDLGQRHHSTQNLFHGSILLMLASARVMP